MNLCERRALHPPSHIRLSHVCSGRTLHSVFSSGKSFSSIQTGIPHSSKWDTRLDLSISQGGRGDMWRWSEHGCRAVSSSLTLIWADKSSLFLIYFSPLPPCMWRERTPLFPSSIMNTWVSKGRWGCPAGKIKHALF